MEIVSLYFVIFVLIILGVYYLLPHRAQNTWLLIASYVFYASFGLYLVLLLLGVTAANYVIGNRIWMKGQRFPKWLWVGIILNIFILFTFKFLESDYKQPLFLFTSRFLNFPSSSLVSSFLLPIGLAFYSLQAISYLIDIYNKHILPSTNIIDFSLYMVYFPKLIAGPIERAKRFLPQLAQRRTVTNEQIAHGFALILVGLIRKVVIADLLPMMMYEGLVWSGQNSDYKTPELVLWVIVYSFTIYNDFAGYTNIVRGVSALFGIELSPNFQQPFFARNFTEFWKRWHISFSSWLRDYIYFHLSRMLVRQNLGQRSILNTLLPPLITMSLSGLWHNLAGYMLIWGLLHGCYQIAERFWTMWRPSIPLDEQPLWRQFIGMSFVFICVSIAWVPFALKTMQGNSGALAFWQALFVIPRWGSINVWYLVVLIPISLSIALDYLQQRSRSDSFFLTWHPIWQSAFLAGGWMLLIVVLLNVNAQTNFVYQGF